MSEADAAVAACGSTTHTEPSPSEAKPEPSKRVYVNAKLLFSGKSVNVSAAGSVIPGAVTAVPQSRGDAAASPPTSGHSANRSAACCPPRNVNRKDEEFAASITMADATALCTNTAARHHRRRRAGRCEGSRRSRGAAAGSGRSSQVACGGLQLRQQRRHVQPTVRTAAVGSQVASKAQSRGLEAVACASRQPARVGCGEAGRAASPMAAQPPTSPERQQCLAACGCACCAARTRPAPCRPVAPRAGQDASLGAPAGLVVLQPPVGVWREGAAQCARLRRLRGENNIAARRARLGEQGELACGQHGRVHCRGEPRAARGAASR